MIELFSFWLMSIVEDDPIPYEISSICFCYTKNGDTKTLFMGGCEFEPKPNYQFDYFPLEAQFFDCNELKKIPLAHYDEIVCDLIDEGFSSDYIKCQYYGKRIYYGEYNTNLKYLFTVLN